MNINQPTIHLMCGFLGFGKTTLAKRLSVELPAVLLTHDQIMVERYGRNPDDFQTKYKLVDEFIKTQAAEYIKQGKSVIMDYGFWTHNLRRAYYEWAKELTPHVIFHLPFCNLATAKQRVLQRSQNDKDALFIDETIFDTLLQQYEPWSAEDTYPVALHNAPTVEYIGKTVWVKMDRPLGSKHPKHGFEYPVNYGFIPFTVSGDGEELDAYVLQTDKPLTDFIGKCTAVIRRTNDNDDKLVVIPNDATLTDESIEKQTAFQEQWFEHILLR